MNDKFNSYGNYLIDQAISPIVNKLSRQIRIWSVLLEKDSKSAGEIKTPKDNENKPEILADPVADV